MPETNELLAVVPHVDDTNFKQFMLSLESLNEEAEALEINTYEDTQKGIEIRKAAKAAENDIENTRIRMVKPLNDHVWAINAKAKEIKEPVLKVLNTIDTKLKAYQAEQDRIAAQKRAEEQARLDAERKVREEEERKKREQEEKERAEAQAKIDAAKKEADEKLRIANEATDAAEKKRLEDEANIAAERAKLEQDKKDFEAKKQADAEAIAKKAEQDRREQEQLQKAEIKPEENVKWMKTRMKFEIINENEVPREFLSVDDKKIREAVKNWAVTIPGVRIFEEKWF